MLFSTTGHSQDFHLSQFDAQPLYLNPALTGLKLEEQWDYRFSMNYREQKGNYKNMSNKTVATGFDMPLNNKFSIGELIMNNQSINGTLNTFNMLLSGAYNINQKNPQGKNKHNLSVGLQMGLLHRSYQTGNFVFDSQYSASSATGFDENIPTGENFVRESFFGLDVNMGVFYRYVNENKKYAPFGGFSIYHLTRPNQSFTDNHSITPMRIMLHGGCNYRVNDAFSLLPQFLFMNQAGANEFNIGFLAYEKIRCTEYQPMLGLSWRRNHAAILHLGLKYKNYDFRISYDITTYSLKKYGNRAIEISFVLKPQKKKKESDLIATLEIVPGTDSIINFKDSLQKFNADTLALKKPLIQGQLNKADSLAINQNKTFSPQILKQANNDSILATDTLKDAPTPQQLTKETPTKIRRDNNNLENDFSKEATSTLPVGKTKKEATKLMLKESVSTQTKERLSPLAPYEMLLQSLADIPSFEKDSLPRISINPKYTTVRKSFRIQLGAFKEDVPPEIALELLKVEAEEIGYRKNIDGFTTYTTGSFSTHDEAMEMRDQMINIGFEDAFIVELDAGTEIISMKLLPPPNFKKRPTENPAPKKIITFPKTADSLFDVFHKTD